MGEVHEAIGRKLAALEAVATRDAVDETLGAVNARWKQELPFLSRDQYLLLGPKVDVARCAGLGPASDPACAREWLIGNRSPGWPESSASSP